MSQGKNNIIKHAQLDWSDQSEPYSTQFDDVYFNNNQGVKESQYVFFQGNDLLDKWSTFQESTFCIIETGFGSGLNFINTAAQFLTFKQTNNNAKLEQLHFISFEQYPLTLEDLNKTLQQFPQFESLISQLQEQYPLPLIGCHRLSFNKGSILLDLWFGDVNQQIDNLSNGHQDKGKQTQLANAWYLDGFNPSKNPEMWQQTLFNKIAKYSKNEATLATFTAAGFVRRGLIEAGFTITKRKGYGKKREMLLGALNPSTSIAIENSERPSDIAIIGGGIASLCVALSLAQRGKKITIYCADKILGERASGNRQGALYPLLNQQHDELGQLFANAYLYALNFYLTLNKQHPFPHQFNGLIQLAYDNASTQKLQKINDANLPTQLIHWIDSKTTNELAGVDIDQQALYYQNAGWLSPQGVMQALTLKLHEYPNLKINYEHEIQSFKYHDKQWQLTEKTNGSFNHDLLIIAAGFDTLKFEQCRALPLSAARGQVSHIKSNALLSQLKRTLCHEGYLTPSLNHTHCMGATFKRHDEETQYREAEQTENYHKLNKCIPNKPWVESINISDQAHTAIRCTTRDHFPYVGALTDYDQLKSNYKQGKIESAENTTLANVYLLTGLGSRGLCTAPLLGEVLASVINQESLPLDRHIYKKMQIPRQWINYMRKNKPLKE
ncbi:bifunctional tRNA (5-methylaminomethyl-2-thiouridine)(34)-methyltransferase MnmD/FAD-dependent 5-carboxymethylaminomethyl-2-thiouridine(34) oxidoreductase MnmC [Psychromonas sp. RZ22]|nr:bifunctional tRNA (5-methylaminomethyl-2-thiouridine)(34)-methyltransferase MnmD/FAD-dependent 5-carboxymethylaminomethyl-2-thiouridine(34) oxidoreductase MnmC [Psychromonas sp. RZ22]